jgi:hypothetical protein
MCCLLLTVIPQLFHTLQICSASSVLVFRASGKVRFVFREIASATRWTFAPVSSAEAAIELSSGEARPAFESAGTAGRQAAGLRDLLPRFDTGNEGRIGAEAAVTGAGAEALLAPGARPRVERTLGGEYCDGDGCLMTDSALW